MKPAPFKYYAPYTLDEALGYMAEYGFDAKAMAGGQSLIPTMNFRLAQPEIIIDLNNLTDLAYIKPADDGGVLVGAMTRQRDVERSPLIAERVPLIHETMPNIAHPQIRNRGTFGGSLAHADPASELPAVALALGAKFCARSQHNKRWIDANDFFVDLFETALEPEELLVEVALPPLPPRTGYAFKEIARRLGDYALVGATAVISLDTKGHCETAKLVFFSVGPGPVEAHQAEAQLKGQALTDDLIEAVAQTASTQDIDPSGDIHASAKYRRHLAHVLTKQVLTKAINRAKENGN